MCVCECVYACVFTVDYFSPVKPRGVLSAPCMVLKDGNIQALKNVSLRLQRSTVTQHE